MGTVAQEYQFDADYRGIFRMLYIAAWFFAAIFIVAGFVLAYGLVHNLHDLQISSGESTDQALAQLLRVGVPVTILTIGASFLIAACFGRAGSNVGRGFLLCGAILLLVFRLGSFIVVSQTILSAYAGQPFFDYAVWRLLTNVNGTLFSLVYPLLCIVAIFTSRRAERR